MNEFNIAINGLKTNYDTQTLLNSGDNIKDRIEAITKIIKTPRVPNKNITINSVDNQYEYPAK